jgi:hypothetical protein
LVGLPAYRDRLWRHRRPRRCRPPHVEAFAWYSREKGAVMADLDGAGPGRSCVLCCSCSARVNSPFAVAGDSRFEQVDSVAMCPLLPLCPRRHIDQRPPAVPLHCCCLDWQRHRQSWVS